MWHIGNVEIKNRVVLAPMAGIGNSAYRRIIKQMGAGLIYAEMVSDKAISYGNEKTTNMLYMTEEERPIVQQIFGSDKDTFVKAAIYIYEMMEPDIIDINMGCPVPKVAMRAQAGSALLKDPQKVYEIVKAVVSSIPIPVTVKIRSGWDQKNINAIEIAKIIEKAGASAIAVHPRTRTQGYSGKSDWSIIKKVKESVSIPVIGNGDIVSVYDAERMLLETGCDAVMIGRGVLGNPWLIKQTIEYLETKKEPSEVSSFDKIEMMRKHLNLLASVKEEDKAILEMRSHLAWYLKGMKGGHEIKRRIFQTKSRKEIDAILNDYEKELKDEK